MSLLNQWTLALPLILLSPAGCTPLYGPFEEPPELESSGDSSDTTPPLGDSGDGGSPSDEPGDESSPNEGSDDHSCPADGNFPVPAWPVAAPQDHGFDPTLLAEAADYAGQHDSNCLVVVRHGAIVGEWYWQGTAASTQVKNWSVGKSYASTVVGLAIDRGDIDSVDQSAADFIPEWQGTEKEAITIQDLLSMSSGLEFDMIADNVTLPLAADMTQLAVDAPLVHTPGLLWEYNNHSVQSLEPVLRNATGMAADVYANQHLFAPMGMDVDWKRDDSGQPALYMNARTSCRDNARFGYLHLREGCWRGERLLSEEWISESTSPSTAMNRGYGYYWWLNGEQPTLDSVTFEEKSNVLHPFAPADAYCGVGLGSQFVEVIPSLDLVLVRMGTAPHDSLAAWLSPGQLIDDLMTDGEQHVHNGVLARVLDALVAP